MALSSIKILGYRGFTTEQTLQIAKPTGRPGSGLTVIVGANNSGKSAIIEALNFLRFQGRGSTIPLAEGQRNSRTNGHTRIEYNTPGGTLALDADGAMDAAWTKITDSITVSSPYVLPARRTFDVVFQPNKLTREQYLSNPVDFGQRQQYGGNFSARLMAIKQNQDKYDKVLHRILRDPPSWYVEKNSNGQHYIKVTGASAPHSGEGLGSGVLSLIQIIDALYDSEKGELIAIDEPELSLHPAAQERLAILLAEYAAERQIVISTHSPFFAPFDYLNDGATIARVSKKNRESVIAQLSISDKSRLKALLNNRNNPHILGLDARRALFLEDNVVLVEGQDDVIAYRQLFMSLGIEIPADFYGWGVGGATNMPTIAAFLHELGFQRVAGILDFGQEETLRSLKDEFPNYTFSAIPASDVRTRQRRELPARKGLLDDDGHLCPEYRDSVLGIGSSLREYFSS